MPSNSLRRHRKRQQRWWRRRVGGEPRSHLPQLCEMGPKCARAAERQDGFELVRAIPATRGFGSFSHVEVLVRLSGSAAAGPGKTRCGRPDNLQVGDRRRISILRARGRSYQELLRSWCHPSEGNFRESFRKRFLGILQR